MFTTRHRGFWIHGHCDRLECRVQRPDLTIMGTFRSLHAAKLAIARAVRSLSPCKPLNA